ncbi:MAG: sugar phosphate isomerase/epimerase [Candidatus Bathyarchaeota archaeon]|nr:sugar phosphate isomerase/epimerase [Candidatus Bathyarchaeota archaeon]MDH5786674.1 sugar phosphate isomerase/epimerase [Candidatus Bathyarchaeota archaeon]
MADYPSLEGSLEDFLSFASKLRIRVLELKLDKLELLLALSKTDKMFELKNLSNSYDFKYFVHATNIDINLASVNPFLRSASKKTILKAVIFAAKLDAGLLVSHVGRLSRDYPRRLVRKAMKNAIDSLRKINQLSNDLGIIFTIENDHKSNDYVLAGNPEQINFLVENVGCKLTFDVGHANTVGKIEDFTRLLDKFIVNVHLHDNNGREDEHLPIGKGSIDFVRLFKRMKDWKSEKPLIIECHSFAGLKESIDFMRQELSV